MKMPEEAMNGMFELLGYFVQDLESRRAGDRTGLITDLLDAEVDGRKLNEQELLGFCVLFVIAGHETTVNLIGTGIRELLLHPEQLELVRDEGMPTSKRCSLLSPNAWQPPSKKCCDSTTRRSTCTAP